MFYLENNCGPITRYKIVYYPSMWACQNNFFKLCGCHFVEIISIVYFDFPHLR